MREQRTGVTKVFVGLDIALSNLKVLLGNNLIEGVGSSAELLASVAVTCDY